MVNVDWAAAGIGWVDPNIPNTSMLVILSILGAVIMPQDVYKRQTGITEWVGAIVSF